MDPFSVTVPGSRYPITIPAALLPVTSTADAGSSPSTSPSSSTSQQSKTPSKIRRKPVQTYKSPTVNDGFRIDSENDAQHISPTSSSSSHTSSSNSAKSERPTLNLRRQQPSLPLYHPLGRLAQSLPALDPRLLGLPNAVSVDDNEMQIDDADPRRASNRSRRPAAKLRDRDQDEGDDQISLNGTPVATGPPGERDARPTTSPRKRRTAGAGAAGGPKRRRRETDDGTFPQPARRTRNPRGATIAASPLAGVALAAAGAGEDAEVGAPMDTPDLQTAVLQAQEARPIRATRSRAPRKRRDSSASTSTSLSISIAVRTQEVVAVVGVPPAEEPSKDVEMAVETSIVNETTTTEVDGERTKPLAEAQVIERDIAADAIPEVGSSHREDTVISSTSPQEPPDLSSPTLPEVEMAAQVKPHVSPTIANETAIEKPGDSPPPSAEKEEGELSDGPSR